MRRVLAVLALAGAVCAPAPAAHAAPGSQPVCTAPAHIGYAQCFASVRTGVRPHVGLLPLTAPSGYGPADLQSAYDLPSDTNGTGATVAIVDAYDDPNAEADLAVYRAQYGLPACTTANGCFQKLDQRGGTSYPATDASWATEISLDLDMVSAICPNCHILLVEADDNNLGNLGAAVDEAVSLGAKYVSNSYGGPEFSGETGWDAYWSHPGVVVTVSSGDSGYGVSFPAASAGVVAVGGTSLVKDASARGWSETAWSGAGSGCSAYEPKPAWQTDPGCSRRSVADVSAVADPNTGVAVYDSYQSGGWGVYGGTSASAPIIASVYALAGPPASATHPAYYPYAAAAGRNDPASGTNGSCSPAYLCAATAGYDGPTGLGTPNGIAAFLATPPVPGGLSAQAASASEIDVQWSAAAGADGYDLERSPDGSTWTLRAHLGPGGTAYQDTGLQPSTTYHYRVFATASGARSEPAGSVFATTDAPAVTFGLQVARTGTGSGTVTSAPAGIHCGAACSASFAQNVSVTLTAAPSAGSKFTGWSGGGCGGTAPCTVSMNQTRKVTATFAALPKITVSGRLVGYAKLSGDYRVYRRGTAVVYDGQTAPKRTGSPLYVTWQKRVSGTWKTVVDARRMTIPASGVVAVRIAAGSLHAGGSYRIQCAYRTDQAYVGATAPWAYFSVAG